MSKPTAGGLRAAKALFETGPAESWYVRADKSLNELTNMIDEATGLPELLAALKDMVEEFDIAHIESAFDGQVAAWRRADALVKATEQENANE